MFDSNLIEKLNRFSFPTQSSAQNGSLENYAHQTVHLKRTFSFRLYFNTIRLYFSKSHSFTGRQILSVTSSWSKFFCFLEQVHKDSFFIAFNQFIIFLVVPASVGLAWMPLPVATSSVPNTTVKVYHRALKCEWALMLDKVWFTSKSNAIWYVTCVRCVRWLDFECINI